MKKEENNSIIFQEVEPDELNGKAQDFVTGFAIGLGIVAAAVAIT